MLKIYRNCSQQFKRIEMRCRSVSYFYNNFIKTAKLFIFYKISNICIMKRIAPSNFKI